MAFSKSRRPTRSLIPSNTSREGRRSGRRSPSPDYILPTGQTFHQLYYFMRSRRLRIPGEEWSQITPNDQREDYVTPGNPRSIQEIGAAFRGDMILNGLRTQFPFMKLPEQLRQRIIEEAMVVPCVAPFHYYAEYTRAMPDKNPPKPNIALLLVNRSIGGEAAKRLYSQNKFLFSRPDYFICTMINVGFRNLSAMKVNRNIVLVDPFRQSLRTYEVEWIVEFMPILKGVMAGQKLDKWDEAWRDFHRFCRQPMEEELCTATALEKYLAMSMFGSVGLRALIKPKEMLMRDLEEDRRSRRTQNDITGVEAIVLEEGDDEWEDMDVEVEDDSVSEENEGEG